MGPPASRGVPRKSRTGITNRRHLEKLKRQTLFCDLIAEGKEINEARAEVGITNNTYQTWRGQKGGFRARLEAAKIQAAIKYGEGYRNLHNGGHGQTFDFAIERLNYFGHESPPFQLEMVHAFENLAPGNLLLVLLPPYHGKTTLYEDWVTLRLAHDPSLRNHVGSESITLSKKILGRVASRLSNSMADGRMAQLILDFGPFAPPQDASRRRGQPWTADHFDVWHKAAFDERDYSMAALGFGSQVIGSRSDHLHIDDVQSTKTLGSTDGMFNTFLQDWLSRPADKGVTTICGNRVDEGDFYEAVMEHFDADVLQVIRYPAIIQRGGKSVPLWPGRWSMESLEKEQRKLSGKNGSDAIWERNWMQRPRSKTLRTFDESVVDGCLRPLRRLGQIESGAAHVIGLDPAIGDRITKGAGRNAIVTCQFDEKGLTPILIREDTRLINTQQILNVLEDQICTVQAGGGYVTDVVIEDNAFQKGLANDPQLDALRRHYHFAIRPHQTGVNKYDDNIGVPSMGFMMGRGEIHIPWAEDDYTRMWSGELRAQFLSWRPLARGAHLRQDLLMALWFVWILYRARRGVKPEMQHAGIATGSHLPYKPTSGLVLSTYARTA